MQKVSVRPQLEGRFVATLGPKGTDSETEAKTISSNIILEDSFLAAMSRAEAEDGYALVPAGYVDREAGRFNEAWVDLHFRFSNSMEMSALWESSTKEMCAAFNPSKVSRPDDVRTVAIHAATQFFAIREFPRADPVYVKAKPVAVDKAALGHVDACIGSVDLVQEAGTLSIVERFHPTMVWCLYSQRI